MVITSISSSICVCMYIYIYMHEYMGLGKYVTIEYSDPSGLFVRLPSDQILLALVSVILGSCFDVLLLFSSPEPSREPQNPVSLQFPPYSSIPNPNPKS